MTVMRYSLTAVSADGPVKSRFLADLERGDVRCPDHTDIRFYTGDDIFSASPVTWDTLDADMKAISTKYQNVLFKVDGVSSAMFDYFVSFFQNGTRLDATVNITKTDPDLTTMPTVDDTTLVGQLNDLDSKKSQVVTLTTDINTLNQQVADSLSVV